MKNKRNGFLIEIYLVFFAWDVVNISTGNPSKFFARTLVSEFPS